MILQLLGYVAQALFIAASVAQARKSWIDGHSDGVSHGLIWMLIIGFSLMMVYVNNTIGFNSVLMLGYVGQILFVLVVAKYKYFPRRYENKLIINGKEVNLDGLLQDQIEAASLQPVQNHGAQEEIWVWDEGSAQYINVKVKK